MPQTAQGVGLGAGIDMETFVAPAAHQKDRVQRAALHSSRNSTIATRCRSISIIRRTYIGIRYARVAQHQLSEKVMWDSSTFELAGSTCHPTGAAVTGCRSGRLIKFSSARAMQGRLP